MTPAADEPVTTAADRVDREPGADIPNVPLLEESIEYEQIEQREEKPIWRGWIHAGTFPLAIVAGIVLLIVADGLAASLSSAVFMISSLLLFGISATYHRFHWSTRARILLKRFDHANIFLLIAGTYTPLSIMALPPEKGYVLLALVWAGALVGIGFRVFWISAPRWAYVPLYVLLGWAAVLYLVDLFAASPAMMILVIVGGLAYTAGAIVYGLKRPNPVPGVFGFHEIFHTLTVVAFLCHWAGVLIIALDPPYGG
ncbi:MAG: hemolysin III family protein [Microcella sp.]|uniref:PAQR family membrane homeostasis protein TrhA n=1 Tax=Microcella sp. TaxID=1913979 RepID=UPI003315E773